MFPFFRNPRPWIAFSDCGQRHVGSDGEEKVPIAVVGRNGGLGGDGEDLREEVGAGPGVGEEVDVLR